MKSMIETMREEEIREGLTKKQQELQDLKIKILALKEQNLSNRAIGRKLEISETKVRNILKK